jgi:3-isopropylmalate dehydrogenase
MLLDWLAERHGDPRCEGAAGAVRAATAKILASGPRTADIGGTAGSAEVTRAIIGALAEANLTTTACEEIR